jgi:hypothetical protein
MVKIPESIANYFKILQISFAETRIWPAAWVLKLACPKLFENTSSCLILSQSTLTTYLKRALGYFAKLLLSYFDNKTNPLCG